MKWARAGALASVLWLNSAVLAQPLPLPERVLVLVNDRMPSETGTGKTGASVFVGNDYAAKRQIPNRNVIHLHTSVEESISYEDYQAEIETPVRKILDANDGAMRKKILYIVPIYGMPLKTGKNGQTVAIDSLLSALYMTPPMLIRLPNPYAAGIGSRPPHFDTWADQRDASGLWKMFLVSRLDGPSAAIAQGLVDKAIAAESGLSTISGTGYFDYQGTRAPSEPLYASDEDMSRAAKLSQSRGFATVLNTQRDSACGSRIHAASALYYDPNTKSVNLASYGADTSVTRTFPAIEHGDIVIGVHGTVNNTGNFVYITLGTPDANTSVRLTYPLAPFTGYQANDQIFLAKNVAGKSVHAALAVDKSMQEVLDGVTEFRFHIQNGSIAVSRNNAPLIALTEPPAAGLSFSSLSIESHCWDFSLTGIEVIKDGKALISDHFVKNTTANYQWNLSPLQGQHALWVWGWYGPAYDAYRFVPGAVGAQLTSYTANTLRKPLNADAAVRSFADRRWAGNWVPRMLEEGVTGTWGAVEEPYAKFYTSGADFFDHFWAGYNFGESFYLAENVLRWTMVAVGDPLYSPAMFRTSAAVTGAQ